MNSKKLSGLALATAAAGLFATAVIPAAHADEHDSKIRCEGVNACMGKSACKTSTDSCGGPVNNCKGLNSCKGRGWLEMTKAECDAAEARMKNQ